MRPSATGLRRFSDVEQTVLHEVRCSGPIAKSDIVNAVIRRRLHEESYRKRSAKVRHRSADEHADRLVDAALQKMRHAGVISYNTITRKWESA